MLLCSAKVVAEKSCRALIGHIAGAHSPRPQPVSLNCLTLTRRAVVCAPAVHTAFPYTPVPQNPSEDSRWVSSIFQCSLDHPVLQVGGAVPLHGFQMSQRYCSIAPSPLPQVGGSPNS